MTYFTSKNFNTVSSEKKKFVGAIPKTRSVWYPIFIGFRMKSTTIGVI